MLTVTLGNQKGGAGKTTTTANLAAVAGAAGLRVLAVDADPQGQLTESFGAQAHPGRSLGELLDTSLAARPNFDAVCLVAVAPNVDLLPAEERPLERAEREMDSDPLGGLTVLRSVLASVAARYDLVLIDTPPRLTSLTTGPLVASDAALLVMEPKAFHFLSARAFVAKIDQVAASPLNPRLRLIGVLLNAVPRDAEEATAVEKLVTDSGWPVLTARIPDSRLASKAALAGLPAVLAYPNQPIAASYQEVANELLERLGDLGSAPPVPDDQPGVAGVHAAVTAGGR
jgi:chromosome partitioning protein